jgi:hypothetical protein
MLARPDVTLIEERWRYPATAERNQAALGDWITAAGVSRYVRVGSRDNRLHLDTHHRAHLDLLLDEITAGTDWLICAPSPDQLGVVRGSGTALHSAEAVVTVAAPSSSRAEPDLTGWPLHDPTDDEHRLLMPGGDWTAFAITAAGHSHDRFLRAFADAFPDLAGRIGDYAIPVYPRELERYGGSRSFQCYERLFCLETAQIVAMLPIIDPNPTLATPAPLIRPGVEAAAGVLAEWLDGLDPSQVNADDVIDVAVGDYSRELGAAAHQIKTALRQRHPQVDVDSDLVAALRGFWTDPGQRDAVMTPTVPQSASHLLCIRLGLQRHEEFAAMWLVKTERNRLERRNARPR